MKFACCGRARSAAILGAAASTALCIDSSRRPNACCGLEGRAPKIVAHGVTRPTLRFVVRGLFDRIQTGQSK